MTMAVRRGTFDGVRYEREALKGALGILSDYKTRAEQRCSILSFRKLGSGRSGEISRLDKSHQLLISKLWPAS